MLPKQPGQGPKSGAGSKATSVPQVSGTKGSKTKVLDKAAIEQARAIKTTRQRLKARPTAVVIDVPKREPKKPVISPEQRFWKNVVESLHEPDSGRLDAARIAEFYGLPLRRLALFLDRTPASVAKTPDAPSLQSDLAIFEQMAVHLMLLAGTAERARMWLNAPNPDLDGESALRVILAGQAAVVADFLADIVNGQLG
jgi:hypothetical protein